jgi:hypothetical protein
MVKRLIGDAEQNAIETYVTYLMTGSRARAKEKKVPHNLRRLGVLEMLVMQQYKCAVSSLPFSMDGLGDDPFLRPFAPSIDRVDNGGGYTTENCRIVCRIVNFAMGKWGTDALRTVALAIAAKEGWTENTDASKEGPVFQ